MEDNIKNKIYKLIDKYIERDIKIFWVDKKPDISLNSDKEFYINLNENLNNIYTSLKDHLDKLDNKITKEDLKKYYTNKKFTNNWLKNKFFTLLAILILIVMMINEFCH